MNRIATLKKTEANEEQKKLLDQAEESYGSIPNILATMARSPAVLKAYLGFNEALSEGTFSESLRQRISLAVSQENKCDYCLAAHTAIGKKAGLSRRRPWKRERARPTTRKRRRPCVSPFASPRKEVS